LQGEKDFTVTVKLADDVQLS